jgi:MFS family permease
MHSKFPEKTGTNREFFYGHVIVGICFLALMVVYGALYSFGVFLKPIITEFGWTRGVTAGAYSLHFLFSGLWSIFAGRLIDRFEPRLIVTCSGLLVGICYLLLSQITAVWQIYLVYGVFLSLGVAVSFVAIYSTVARWFTTSRGLASGIVSAGIGLGVVVMPPLANLLINRYSWHTSFLVIGLIALAIPVIAQFLKRAPLQLRKETDGKGGQQDKKASWSLRGLSPLQAITTRQFWIISATWFVLNLCIQTVFVHLVAYVTDKGISSYTAAAIMSVIGIVCIIGKVGIGSALDKLRSKSVYIIVGILMVCSFLLLQLPGLTGVLYIFAVIFAIGYGGLAAAQSPSIAEYFGLRSHGTVFGVALFAACLGGAIGPFMTGYIFDMTGSYDPAFIACAAICLVGIIPLVLLRPTNINLAADSNGN